jgi:hypothetical protein
MYDPLLIRAQKAINEALSIQEARCVLLSELESAVYELRWAVHLSACARAHSRARHDEQTK